MSLVFIFFINIGNDAKMLKTRNNKNAEFSPAPEKIKL